MPRKHVPNDVRLKVLAEAGFRCAIPTCRTILVHDLHHIIEVRKGGGNTSDNLLCLCPTCHALYHRGHIPPEAIGIWKMILVSLNRAYDKEAIDYLLTLHTIEKNGDDDFRLIVSGDGLLRFSALFNSEMIDVLYIPRSRYGHDACYSLSLSEKGSCFVTAWKSGKLKNLEVALGKLDIEGVNDTSTESGPDSFTDDDDTQTM